MELFKGKTLYRMDEYELGRMEANKIIASLLPNFNYPVLILCRSHLDDELILLYLTSVPDIEIRLYMFDELASGILWVLRET